MAEAAEAVAEEAVAAATASKAGAKRFKSLRYAFAQIKIGFAYERSESYFYGVMKAGALSGAQLSYKYLFRAEDSISCIAQTWTNVGMVI